MQRRLNLARRHELEEIKEAGLTLDFDEIARKGSMSAEEKQVSKFYGVYSSRQKGDHMVRVVVPGGVMTAAEARAMGKLADKYSPGVLSVTTRQSIQYHKIQLPDIPGLLRDLAAAGKTTWHGCGDVARNVQACPWAEICPHRRLNVQPLAEETAEAIAAFHELDNLPRKFKVNYSGCTADCGQPWINCVGFRGILRRNAGGSEDPGLHAVIGGGMGWSPFVAQTLYTFVPPDKAVALSKAVGLLFRDHGDRFHRAKARLKYVVHRQGIDRCREIVEENLRYLGVSTDGLETGPVEDVAPPVPHRPLRESDPVGTDGEAIVRIKVPKGEISGKALVGLANLAETHADRHVYSTNRQNLVLHGVDPKRAREVRDGLAKLGLETEDFFGLTDVVACVGTTYCPLAVSETRAMFDRLQPVLRDERFAEIRDRGIVNITGCPNSCSPYYIADIGLRGMRIRRAETGSDEAYQIRLGGTQTKFGEVLGEYKSDDCPAVVERVLETFAGCVEGDETLAQNIERVGMAPYVQAVGKLGISYDKAPNPTEYTIETGRGESELDLATIAKDVPCQEGCPARTDVPAYIEAIAHGDYDRSYRINQEDNVFPGVLGRVCTRPCEPACRHMWTNTHGPVRICHLKRVAADHKKEKAKPLPPWYGATGKRVAVLGGGPAGLTGARELKRFGHDVTIFESSGTLGGMMRIGIPAFRLPREVIDEEIAAIIDSGIDVRYKEEIDAARVGELLEGGEFDAVLLTVGAHIAHPLELPGLEAGAAIEGLPMMRAYNEGNPLPLREPVVVIGGGFTAVDCVRVAKRVLGEQAKVGMFYRRGPEQMAANPEELREIRHEGIEIETLVSPVSARMEGGKLAAVTFRRNTLGEPAQHGAKPPMYPVPGSEFEVPAGTLVVAIGQGRHEAILPEGVSEGGGHATSHPKLFCAGDFAFGSEAIIDAVADAKGAADEIDEALMGEKRRKVALDVDWKDDTGRLRDHDLLWPPDMPVRPIDERGGEQEVELGFGTDDGDTHAWRCYLCNHKYEIDQDKCIHCDWCIKVSPRRCILRLDELELDQKGAPVNFHEVPADNPADATYIWIDSDQCIRCGNCIRVCPTEAITLRLADRVECTNCGS